MVPKKFLCYSLRIGAWVMGIILTIASIIGTIILLLQILNMDSSKAIWATSFSVMIVACLDCGMMFCINLWFLWGIKCEKTSVILSWLVLTVFWLVQAFIMLTVQLIMLGFKVRALAWGAYAVLSAIAVVVALYGMMCVYGYWLQLQAKKKVEATNESS